MSRDIEHRLERAAPLGPSAEVRTRVLAAVNEELARDPGGAGRRLRPGPGVIAAASLLAAVMLNVLVNTALDWRMAKIIGPTPIPRQAAELAADIAAVTDAETGEWAFRRLTSAPLLPSAPPYSARIQELIRQLTVESQEPRHEATEDNPQVDRRLRGRLDRGPAGGQRVLRLEHRNRA